MVVITEHAWSCQSKVLGVQFNGGGGDQYNVPCVLCGVVVEHHRMYIGVTYKVNMQAITSMMLVVLSVKCGTDVKLA